MKAVFPRLKTTLLSSIFSFLLSVILWFFPDEQLIYIDKIVDLILLVIPALLGLTLAGFSIAISHINENALRKITNVDIDDDKDFSFYQILNAVFAVTVFANP